MTRPQGAVPWGTGSSTGVCCFADRSNRGSRRRGTPKTKKNKKTLRDLLDLSYHAGTCMTEHYLRRESVSLLSSNVQVPVLAYYTRLSRNYQISAGPKGKPVIYHIVCMYVPKLHLHESRALVPTPTPQSSTWSARTCSAASIQYGTVLYKGGASDYPWALGVVLSRGARSRCGVRNFEISGRGDGRAGPSVCFPSIAIPRLRSSVVYLTLTLL